MQKINPRSITLDQIAKYSSWPSKLLSIEPFAYRHKNASEINREFGDEKWGRLLDIFEKKSTFSLNDLEIAEQNLNQEIPCYSNSLGFYLIRVRQANIEQIKIYESILSKYASSSSALVELGAGYGSKILQLSNFLDMSTLPLFAGEYTQSGCNLISLLAKNMGKNIQVGHCDFNNPDLLEIEIPENAIIFTSYSVHYVPELNRAFVDFLKKFKPRVVVHFEPCFEFFDAHSLHGLMCRRYMELNDYTKNIASTIIDGCDRIGASIQIQKNVHGCNPFLPFSVIEWSIKD